MPSMEMTEYRVHFGEKPKNTKSYFEMEIPFEEMDNAWIYATNLVKSGHASKVSCSTPLAHKYFHMNKAVVALYPNEINESDDLLEGMIKLVFSYPWVKKNIVFN